MENGLTQALRTQREGLAKSIWRYNIYLERITVNQYIVAPVQGAHRERSGSVVECSTRDRMDAGSSLTGVTVLCP